MKNEKKSNNSFFTFTFVTFALPFFDVAGYWKCSNTTANIDIHWLCRHHT